MHHICIGRIMSVYLKINVILLLTNLRFRPAITTHSERKAAFANLGQLDGCMYMQQFVALYNVMLYSLHANANSQKPAETASIWRWASTEDISP